MDIKGMVWKGLKGWKFKVVTRLSTFHSEEIYPTSNAACKALGVALEGFEEEYETIEKMVKDYRLGRAVEKALV